MMDSEIKKLWVEALRSDKYKQATGRLEYDGGYCCLGLLCVIQGVDLYKHFKNDMHHSSVGVDLSAGLAQQEQWDLANMNDAGQTFRQIADYIEANH